MYCLISPILFHFFKSLIVFLHYNRQRLIKVLFLDGDCFGFVSKETEGQLYFLFGGRVIKFDLTRIIIKYF